MTDIEKLISEVKEIILRHAHPERIWLYGSRATGEATVRLDDFCRSFRRVGRTA